jgi:DNA ligase-1
MNFDFDAAGLGPPLYKLDSSGKVRIWYMELKGHRYRTHSGLLDGKYAVSEWTEAAPASRETPEQQAEFEVRARYQHQLDREYHETVGTLDTPKIIEPMLAKSYTKWPGVACYIQPKLDGIRCIMTKDGMFSREGQPIVAVPHLHACLKEVFERDPWLVLDGELYNHDLRDDFNEISSIVRKKNPTAAQFAEAEAVMQYHVYDAVDSQLHFGSRFIERHYAVHDSIPDDHPWIKKVETKLVQSAAEANAAYADYVDAGYEGAMIRLNGPYERGKRSKQLLKWKEFITEEFLVKDVLPGKGNWAKAAKSIQLITADGKPFGAGIRGKRTVLTKMLENWDHNPLASATVRYFQMTPDGVPRFGVVVDFHPTGRKD